MKRLLKPLILSLSLITISSTLTGCGSFFSTTEEAVQIKEITTLTLDDGSTKITISYFNEDMDPTTFIIPKGLDGNGISDITYEKSKDGSKTLVSIMFTDEMKENVQVEIPNGISITDITSSFDEATNMTAIKVNFSDGSSSDPIYIPKGEKGDDGVSIVGISQRINRDNSVTLTIDMSEGDDILIDIPAPQKGIDGRGIKDIVTLPNGDTYTMIITYTDDDVKELEFARPNKWFSESGIPSDKDGINGDLWYDLSHQIIYVKQNNKWVLTMNFNNVVSATYSVAFNLNDLDGGVYASMPAGSLLSYDIPCNSYFAASGYTIPTPTRDGYNFTGWYTVPNPSVINGLFTDLTIVNSDLTLYASWDIKD